MTRFILFVLVTLGILRAPFENWLNERSYVREVRP